MSSGYRRNCSVMHLLHCLFFAEAHYNMHVTASHIPDTQADTLSRNNLSSFFSQAPHMARQPVPQYLLCFPTYSSIRTSCGHPQLG